MKSLAEPFEKAFRGPNILTFFFSEDEKVVKDSARSRDGGGGGGLEGEAGLVSGALDSSVWGSGDWGGEGFASGEGDVDGEGGSKEQKGMSGGWEKKEVAKKKGGTKDLSEFRCRRLSFLGLWFGEGLLLALKG